MAQFVGQLKNDQPWTGTGKWIFDNGGEFEGTWQDGQPWTGVGELYYEGYYFKGTLLNGRPSKGKLSMGVFTFEGKWNTTGERVKGTVHFPGGSFSGTFKNDEYDDGEINYDNGDYFKGTFANGTFLTGSGKETDSDDVSFTGEWADGQYWNGQLSLAQQTFEIRAGLIYLNHRPLEGEHSLIFPNGSWFNGAWKNGKRCQSN